MSIKRNSKIAVSVFCFFMATLTLCSCDKDKTSDVIKKTESSFSNNNNDFDYEISENHIPTEAATEEPTEDPEIEQMNTDIEEAKRLIEKGKYSDAYNQINMLTTRYGSEDEISELSEMLEELLEKAADEQIEKYFSNLDYSSAQSYMSDLCSTYGYEELTNKSNTLEDDFTDYVLDESESNAATGNYEAASAIIQTAMNAVGNENEALTNAYNEYRSHLPVYITDLNYMSCLNNVRKQDNLKDNIGNLYHNGLYMGETHHGFCYGEGSADYYIQGKYETFSGTVAVESGNEGSNYSAYFEVYGDGNLLYTSPIMTNTSLPENFLIDITGVQILKISYPDSNESADMATIYDGLLTPVSQETTTISGE